MICLLNPVKDQIIAQWLHLQSSWLDTQLTKKKKSSKNILLTFQLRYKYVISECSQENVLKTFFVM